MEAVFTSISSPGSTPTPTKDGSSNETSAATSTAGSTPPKSAGAKSSMNDVAIGLLGTMLASVFAFCLN
jgi:hypothetical protein